MLIPIYWEFFFTFTVLLIKINMDIKVIESRMLKTINMLYSLEPEEFNFNKWVSSYDMKNNCARVCDIAGWYPKYVPESGLFWDNHLGEFSIRTNKGDYLQHIFEHLSEWHGFNKSLVKYLFVPNTELEAGNKNNLTIRAKPYEVADFWENFLIDINDYKKHLILN